MRCSTGASAFSAAHQMLCGCVNSTGPGPCFPSLSPSCLQWPCGGTLGAWPLWGHGCIPGHNRPSAHALLQTGGAGVAVAEGHLFGAVFHAKLLVPSSLAIIHHTKRPRPLRDLLALVPRSGGAGCSGANRETQSVFLPLQLLAWSLVRSPAGGIGSWLSLAGDGVWTSIALVRSPGLPAPAFCGMCRHLRCGTGTCGRTWGFGGQVELRNWIFCRK